MQKIVVLFGSILALALFPQCAPLDPELPSGDEQQLDRPSTLGGTARGNPLDAPDEATLPYVPGQ